MGLKLSNQLKEFNLLSIGQRGVGKTVFLVGSYLEINNSSTKNKRQKFSLQCDQPQAKDNLEGVIAYVASTGKYPPPTLKVSSFPFILQRQTVLGQKNLCRLSWWDLPGEYCDLNHSEFQQIVMSSHSCCLFINADELVNNTNYFTNLKPSIKQAIAIASLVKQQELEYNFAIIFTQFDRLEAGLAGQIQIEEKIAPLIKQLEATSANYKRFYSAIPIQGEPGNYQFKPQGAAAPLLWLTSQLVDSNPQQLAQNLENSSKLEFVTPNQSQRASLSYVGLLVIAIAGFLVAIATFSLTSNWNKLTARKTEAIDQSNQSQPTTPPNLDQDFSVLVQQANEYIQQGNLQQALPVVEKIVEQQPDNLNWQLNLAKIYELQANKTEAEAVYDRILTQENKNLSALIGKAILRNEQGDSNTAKELLKQAEQFAPTEELKNQVRAIAGSLF